LTDRLLRHLFCTALSLSIGLLQAAGAELVLRPSADTTLLEIFPTNNLGGAKFFNAGTTQNGNTNRALLAFDLSAILSGSRIEEVELLLEVVRQPSDGYEASRFALHRVLVPWGEGTRTSPESNHPGFGAPARTNEASWYAPLTGVATWALPGGKAGTDFAAVPSSAEWIYDIGSSPYFFRGSNLVADVQRWLEFPQQNFGWLLKTESELTRFTARSFGSREDPVNSPLLRVVYRSPLQLSAAIREPEFVLTLHTPEARGNVLIQQSSNLVQWTALTNLVNQTNPATPVEVRLPLTSPAQFFRAVAQD
jgi:hypothetical protein